MISWALVIVAAVAVSYAGVTVQNAWKNPLGDVYSLGLGSAICSGGILAICYGINPSYGALCIGILFYFLALSIEKLPIHKLVTLGLVLGTALGSITTITATNLRADALQQYYMWSSTRIPDTISSMDSCICVLLFSLGIFLCKKFPGPASATLLTTSVIFLTAPIWTIGIVCPNLARLTSRNVSAWSIGYGVVILSIAYTIVEYVEWCYLPLSSVVSILTIPCYVYTVLKNEIHSSSKVQ